MRYWFKECPRCKGDLRDELDIYGRYICCVQCGYILSQAEEARLQAVGTLKEPVAAAQAGPERSGPASPVQVGWAKL